jgi:[ribosomal protein S18]-alanine N-acetyltransferase
MWPRLISWLLPWRTQSARTGAITSSDAPALARLHAKDFARGWSVMEFQQLLTDQTIVCDGLFRGRSTSPLGFALSRVAGDEAELLTIVVLDVQRGRGNGGLLLNAHVNRLALRGVHALFLEVDAANKAALALYQRRGFREVGRREAYYPMPDGSRATALVMRRDLA